MAKAPTARASDAATHFFSSFIIYLLSLKTLDTEAFQVYIKTLLVIHMQLTAKDFRDSALEIDAFEKSITAMDFFVTSYFILTGKISVEEVH